MIYYIIIAIFLFLGFFSKAPKIHYYLSIFILFVFTAFRDTYLGGTDAISYQSYFNNQIPTLGDLKSYTHVYEYGYAFINSMIKTFSSDYRVFQFFYTVLAIFLLHIVIKNLNLTNREKCLFLFIYFCFRFFLNNFVLLRQNIANLLIWIVILKYLDKPIQRSLTILSTWFFHRTSVANIIIFQLLNIGRTVSKKKMLIITAGISIIAILTSKLLINKLVEALIIFAGNKYEKYLVDGDLTIQFNIINFVIRWLVILFIYYYFDKIQNENKGILLYTGFLAIIIGSFNTEIFTRMLEYYMIAIYGSMTVSYQAIPRSKQGIYLIGIFLVFITILIRNLYTTSLGMFMDYSFFWK